ncbi:MAG: TenA family protein [Pseudonocardiaceae bacterium]
MRDELQKIGGPVLREVLDHPFWTGLRNGSLPPPALVHFVLQDTGYLLPAFARALARCAAAAVDDKHALLLMRGATATLQARDRLDEAFGALAPAMNIRPPSRRPAITPATSAYCSLFAAASARSVVAGIGATLPMVWFQRELADDLITRVVPGSQYARWIESYHPGAAYGEVVEQFLAMADEIGDGSSAAERHELVDQFSTAARYEWRFAEEAGQAA